MSPIWSVSPPSIATLVKLKFEFLSKEITLSRFCDSMASKICVGASPKSSSKLSFFVVVTPIFPLMQAFVNANARPP